MSHYDDVPEIGKPMTSEDYKAQIGAAREKERDESDSGTGGYVRFAEVEKKP